MSLDLSRFPHIILAVLVLVLASSPPARAERGCNVPAGYYRVVNIEGPDPVIFRALPTHASALLRALQPGDIVQSDGTRGMDGGDAWQQVRVSETDGWVQAQHLWRVLPRTLDKSVFPTAGWCGAFVPLWSIHWQDRRVSMSLYPGRYDFEMGEVRQGQSSNAILLSGETKGVSLQLIYGDQVCKDQNELMQGLGSIYAIVRRNGSEQLYSGCCSAAVSAFSNRPVPGMTREQSK